MAARNPIWVGGVAVLGLLLALGAGCADHGHRAHDDTLSVTQAWSRAIPPSAPVAAGFMTIHNGTDAADRLVSARSDAAASVEIHEIRPEDGVARMREVAGGLPLAAGASVELKPGGYHLMFIAPGDGFVPGAQVTATLVFEQAGDVQVAFEVREVGATARGQPGHEGH